MIHTPSEVHPSGHKSNKMQWNPQFQLEHGLKRKKSYYKQKQHLMFNF
jgi:hypothetical protein